MQQRLHSNTLLMIPPWLQAFVPTNTLSFLLDRDFYFKSTQQPKLSLFAHLISHNTKDILVLNESDLSVQILYKLKLGMVTKIPFDNCFNATIETNLAIVPLSNPSKPQQVTATMSQL